MIRPGVCLCPACGHTSTTPYYTNSERAVAAWLKKSSRIRQTYYLEPTTKSILQLADSGSVAASDGFPDCIQAYLNDGSAPITMQRSCPMCHLESNSVTRFHRFIGRIPMFTVAVVGVTSAGKSSWLGALSSGTLNALNHQKYPYALIPALPNTLVELSGSTPESSSGSSNFIQIFKKDAAGVARDLVALVLVLDTAGENYKQFQIDDIFTANAHNDSPLSRFIHGDGTEFYTGIDAAVVIDPAVVKQSSTGMGYSIGAICAGIRDRLLNVPVAYVHSFADELIEKEKARCGAKKHVPRITKDTFPNTICSEKYIDHVAEYFTPEALKERIRLQDHICRTLSYSTYNSNNIEGNKCGFLVRSCKPDGGKSSLSNFEEQFNVADPLIWLLVQLRLFPLRLTEGGGL